MSNFFVFILSLVVGLFFIMLGIIGVMIPWDAGTRTAVVMFIFENSISIVLFGFAFIILGAVILVNLILGLRRRSYLLRSGKKPITLDESIIQDYINSYWRETFPAYEIPSRLTIKRNKIHVYADLPYVPRDQQRDFLENIRNELSDLFSRTLGYQQEFYLSISFQRNPSKSRILTNER